MLLSARPEVRAVGEAGRSRGLSRSETLLPKVQGKIIANLHGIESSKKMKNENANNCLLVCDGQEGTLVVGVDTIFEFFATFLFKKTQAATKTNLNKTILLRVEQEMRRGRGRSHPSVLEILIAHVERILAHR